MNFDLVFAIAAFSCLTAMSVITSPRQWHMLQLNSYKNHDYFKWVKENFTPFYPAFLLAVFFPAFFGAPLVMASCATILLTVFSSAFFSSPEGTKKPLVYTFRVKRLIFTQFKLFAIFTIAGGLFYIYEQTIASLICYSVLWIFCLFPFLPVALANFINKPVEKYVSYSFVAKAKQKLAHMPELLVVGITGSYGKTSTKFFLGELLSQKYNTLVTPESFNTTLGVTRTINDKLKPTHQIFVCEMGAKYKGDIKEICDIVHPKMGIITSIGPQHLETFKSMETIINTKFELIDSLPENGTAILNFDNPYIKENPISKKVVSYGTGECDYKLSDISCNENGSSFTVLFDRGKLELQTKLLGRHNILNIAAAVAVARLLDVPDRDIARAVKGLKPVPHRLELMNNGLYTAIDDSFNSNPEGAAGALEALSMFSDRLRVLVTPGIIELGEKEYEENYKLGKTAAASCDLAILVGPKRTKPIYDGLVSEGFDTDSIFVVKSLKAAAELLATKPACVALFENDLPDNFSE